MVSKKVSVSVSKFFGIGKSIGIGFKKTFGIKKSIDIGKNLESKKVSDSVSEKVLDSVLFRFLVLSHTARTLGSPGSPVP